MFISLHAQAVISEIMYNPEDDERINEFVEVVNLSPTDTLDFSGWTIQDKSGSDTIEESGFGSKVAPGGYGIIFGSDYSIEAGIYQDIIPPGAILMRVDDTRIGNGLGNEEDSLFFYNASGILIDSLGYSDMVQEGYSLEKIYLDQENTLENWAQSLDSLGTPGAPNSVIPFDIDAAVVSGSVYHEPLYPNPGEEVTLTVSVANPGIMPFSGSIAVSQENITLLEDSFSEMMPGDTLSVSMVFSGFSYGEQIIDISVSVFGEMNPLNNTVEHSIDVSHPFGIVTLNEFLSRPETGQSEFIELVSTESVNLSGWTVMDETDTERVLPNLSVHSGEFIVIATDSIFQYQVPASAVFAVPVNGFPSLNNDEDKIAIFDKTGAVIDSLIYTSDWPLEDGRSTEKFRPEYLSAEQSRWGVSVVETAMTPGEQNSLYYEKLPGSGTIEYYPNPFSPDGDGIDDRLFIHCKFPFEQAILKLEIFDMVGRTIATPYWNVVLAQETLISWDGYRNNGSPARIGIYLIKVTARDASTGKTWEDIQTVVLAKKL